MATPVEVIYSKFLSSVDDIELSMIEDEELEDILFNYLENSTVEFIECEKDLTVYPRHTNEMVLNCGEEDDSLDFGVKEIFPTTITDGVDDDFTNNTHHLWEIPVLARELNEFKLFYLEETVDPSFSVGGEESNDIIDGVEYDRVPLEEGVDYKIYHDIESSVVYICSLKPFSRGEYLYFIHSSEPYILDDLGLDEIYILAYGMTLSWISPKIKREENLRQMMNDRDFKHLSSANMLGKLIELSQYTRKELMRYKQRYSYKNFIGFD